MACVKPFDDDRRIFMKILGVKVDDVPDWKRPPKLCRKHQDMVDAGESETPSVQPAPKVKPCISSEELVGRRTEKGYLVSVNDELIALFKVMGKVYAVKDSCPHAGGPLSMGDIEELPGEGLCVRCPWHHWKILLDSGTIGEHKGRTQSTVVYPVKINEEGEIYIGFDQVSRRFFNLDLHPSVDIVHRAMW